MKKKVTVLIIDDVDQSKIIDALNKQLKRTCEFEAISIRTTDVELREDGSDHLDVIKLKERIKDLISSKHINWALTDFNLSEDDIDGIDVWGIERSGFFNGRGKWAKGFENQRV